MCSAASYTFLPTSSDAPRLLFCVRFLAHILMQHRLWNVKLTHSIAGHARVAVCAVWLHVHARMRVQCLVFVTHIHHVVA